ncbi:hypothetical protein [Leptolyngbya sp. 7M]|uniref:hypothetical protein n=1 Tax=Leptolyngbya sp. 7M TaxID=2812896 RepID=UPI001B8C6569|nr:hypothetical protein [Leptolyngbya sp. 7M]QYO67260.1 hypothetical protein JVX88_10900 [Leptolyngbya sp. 7M]
MKKVIIWIIIIAFVLSGLTAAVFSNTIADPNSSVKAGIKAVLNVAPVPLTAAEDVKVKSVDLTISLESLSFHLSSEPGVEREMKPISRTGRKL